LDSTLVLDVDRGVSAFRGDNLRDGALGQFLELARRGQITAGSYLIVENLDRFSRDQVEDALGVFIEIINLGIVIVTLAPEREFRKGQMDIHQFILAIAEFSRANSESQAKSFRSRANWEKRRARIGEEALTGCVPNWIDVVDGQCVLNKEKAAVVRRIFQLAIGGMGGQSIATTLNAEQVPHSGKMGGRKDVDHWMDSTVYKILTSRACIGEFQPRRKVEKDKRLVREPVGPPISGYFPAVVDEATFFAAQRAIRLRKKRGTGRAHAPGALNLFVGLVQDEQELVYTFRERNGYHYLVLKNYRRDRTEVQSLKYGPFEEALLTWLKELNLQLDEGVSRVSELRGRMADLERRIEVITRQVREKTLESLFGVLAELEAEQRWVRDELEEAEVPRGDILSRTQDLIGELAAAVEPDKLRRLLRQQLRAVVEKIVVEHIEGHIRNSNKVVFLRVEFTGGTKRFLWYHTNREGLVATGLRQEGDGFDLDGLEDEG
jgi:DNA invertase Pin-like site-specific DNA recombinase